MYYFNANKDLLIRNDFIEIGFKSHDINDLIEKGFVVRISHGKYMIVKDENLFDYEFRNCIDLVLNGSLEEAVWLFKVCCKVNSKYIDELFKLILESIKVFDYDLVFKFFNLVLSGDDFLRVVESCEDKSEILKREIEDIRRTRKFYVYQDKLRISRILMPKRKRLI